MWVGGRGLKRCGSYKCTSINLLLLSSSTQQGLSAQEATPWTRLHASNQHLQPCQAQQSKLCLVNIKQISRYQNRIKFLFGGSELQVEFCYSQSYSSCLWVVWNSRDKGCLCLSENTQSSFTPLQGIAACRAGIGALSFPFG